MQYQFVDWILLVLALGLNYDLIYDIFRCPPISFTLTQRRHPGVIEVQTKLQVTGIV